LGDDLQLFVLNRLRPTKALERTSEG
jgi:hypothetical protein